MLIVTPTYAEAERVAWVRGHQDWLWFSTVEIAMNWVQRCLERGVHVNAVIRDFQTTLQVAA